MLGFEIHSAVPARYQLGLVDGSKGVDILVPPFEIASFLEFLEMREAYIQETGGKHQVADFVMPKKDGSGRWGFGQAVESLEDGAKWRVQFPIGDDVQVAKTSGSDIFELRKMLSANSERAASFSVTLAVVFNYLNNFSKTNFKDGIQQMTVEMVGRSHINATLGLPVYGWLARQPDQDGLLAEVVRGAYKQISGDSGSIYQNMGFLIREGRELHLYCPGDRAGLDPVAGLGNSLYPHNIDTSAQQLALLAGLAGLCDRASLGG